MGTGRRGAEVDRVERIDAHACDGGEIAVEPVGDIGQVEQAVVGVPAPVPVAGIAVRVRTRRVVRNQTVEVRVTDQRGIGQDPGLGHIVDSIDRDALDARPEQRLLLDAALHGPVLVGHHDAPVVLREGGIDDGVPVLIRLIVSRIKAAAAERRPLMTEFRTGGGLRATPEGTEMKVCLVQQRNLNAVRAVELVVEAGIAQPDGSLVEGIARSVGGQQRLTVDGIAPPVVRLAIHGDDLRGEPRAELGLHDAAEIVVPDPLALPPTVDRGGVAVAETPVEHVRHVVELAGQGEVAGVLAAARIPGGQERIKVRVVVEDREVLIVLAEDAERDLRRGPVGDLTRRARRSRADC